MCLFFIWLSADWHFEWLKSLGFLWLTLLDTSIHQTHSTIDQTHSTSIGFSCLHGESSPNLFLSYARDFEIVLDQLNSTGIELQEEKRCKALSFQSLFLISLALLNRISHIPFWSGHTTLNGSIFLCQRIDSLIKIASQSLYSFLEVDSSQIEP